MSEQMDGQQPSGNPTPQSGVLMDPLSVRNTDTGNMKRMAAESSSHNQARKTIKLKPLAIKKGGVAPSDLTAASMTAAVPAASSPVSAPAQNTDAAVGDQATVAMERIVIEEPTQKLQKSAVVAAPSATPSIPVAAPAHSSIAPSALPGSKQTIKLRPSTSGISHVEATVLDQRPASAQTIKLSPKPATPATPASAPAVSEVPAQSLREVQTVAMARQTIRLVPKKAEVTSSAPVQPKPSDPTINLQQRSSEVEETAPTIPRPSDPTTRLAPTQMIPPPQVEAEQEPDTGTVPVPGEQDAVATGTKPKIGVKHHVSSSILPSLQENGGMAPGDEAEPLVESPDGVKVKVEPSIIFTIAAVLSLLTIGFLSFLLFAQFNNHWWGGGINVPGLVKLTGSK